MLKRFLNSINVTFWVFVAFFSISNSVQAQEYTNSELDTLVSSIALYPDPLLVQVLTASTYGDQIPAANRFAQNHKNLAGEALADVIEKAEMGYDPSVQALIPFPNILDMMDKYAAWSNQLGEAMMYQKEDVMEAVQRMRQKAYRLGHLQTNNQVKVVVDKEIVIQPMQYEYIYVPVYNPSIVYYAPYRGGRLYLNYGRGVLVGGFFGEWGWGTSWFDWNYHVMYVRNHDWYYHRRIPHHPRRYVPPHRSYGPPPGHRSIPRQAPAPAPSARVSPSPRQAPAPAPSARVSPSPRQALAPAPSARVSPSPRQAPAPAPSARVSPSPRQAPAPAPSARVSPSPRQAPAPAPSARMSPSSRQAPAPAPSARVSPSPRQAPAPRPSSDDNDKRTAPSRNRF